jgi:predicted TIM-barrel fold metal-dependent hydrolase
VTRYAQTLSDDARAKVLGDNVRRIYRLPKRRRQGAA